MAEYTKLIEFTDEGLRTSTKPEILNVLTNMTVEAFGADFAVDEGSAWYIFLDSLSNSLDNVCTAARELYNAQGIINANGSNLDNIVSLAGIYRKKGEADEQLRNRAIKSVYSSAVGVEQSLESALLNIIYTDAEGNRLNALKYAKIINNPTAEELVVNNIYNIPAHSIWIIVQPNDSINLSENTEIRNSIAKVIKDYKTLGCGVWTPSSGTTNYTVKIRENNTTYNISFSDVSIITPYIKVVLNWTTEWNDTAYDGKKAAIRNNINTAIFDYINTLNIGQDVLYNRIASVISDINTYNDYVFDITSITISNTESGTGTKIPVAVYEQAKLTEEQKVTHIIVS